MTHRRLPAMPAQPQTAGRGPDEQPQPACDRDLIDALYAGGVASSRARETLLNARCGVCPVRPQCWSDAGFRRLLQGTTPGDVNWLTGKPKSEQQQAKAAGSKWAKFNAARTQDLTDLIASGAMLEEVCARLGITAKSLHSWCLSQKRTDLWQAIKPPKEPGIVQRPDRRRRKQAAA